MFATIILGVVLLYIMYKYLSPNPETRKLLEKVPGPKPLPLIGNAHQLRMGHAKMVQTHRFASMFSDYGFHKMKIIFYQVVFLYRADWVEVVLNSMKHIDKSPDYNFLHPWLGTGLLTSTGNKWKSRRRMLTPTFHFNILHDFLHVFNKKSHILVDKFKGKAAKGDEFNVFQDIALCALDIISETAMGKDIDAQSTDSEYVHAVYRMSTLTDTRMRKPWLWPKFLFKMFGPGHEYDEKLKILHDFTNSVISDRLKDFDGIKSEMIRQEMNEQSEGGLGEKKIRLAFLDMLIYMSDNLTKLSIEDIREEVDTFMFEGHDTTAAAMNWATHLIGANPEVQAKVHEEIDSIFGQDNRDPTMEDLKDMKYLECCIKVKKNIVIKLRNLILLHLPSWVTIVFLFIEMRNVTRGLTVVVPIAKTKTIGKKLCTSFQSRTRHPYSYVPFSAGPRNCIGQKFALLEEKTVLCHLFRNFTVKSCQTREELRPVGDLILRPENGIIIKLSPRV
ncbi:hypothetical protein EGW08_002134 [Elysia chlorotica]|uniref:Cytochrome P450 n=1 Tax=Elysia chlorotica TaxID=188477 RepID=A0A433U8F6_ELYCH|nr:hypothetical protein EGW08_002134 [Elysia chlorotica]